jgi:hypothetical protein
MLGAFVRRMAVQPAAMQAPHRQIAGDKSFVEKLLAGATRRGGLPLT